MFRIILIFNSAGTTKQFFSISHSVQTSSGVLPASYPMGTGSSFPGGKMTGVWSWPLTVSAEVKTASTWRAT